MPLAYEAARPRAEIEQFASTLRARRLSPETCRSYAEDLALLAASCAGETASFPAGVTTEHVERFVATGALRTRERRLSTLVAFFDWAKRCGLVAENPAAAVERPLRPQAPREWLTAAELEQVLVRADEECGQRDPAIVHVLAATGITVAELVALNRGDVMAVGRATYLLSVRGPRARDLRVADRAGAQLRRWLGARRGDPSTPLFPSNRGGRLLARSLDRRISLWGVKAGLPFTITPRAIRNSPAPVPIKAAPVPGALGPCRNRLHAPVRRTDG